MIKQAILTPHSSLRVKVIRTRTVDYNLEIKRLVKETQMYFRILLSALLRPFNKAVAPEARLFAKIFRADGTTENLGLICTKVVTDVGVAFIVDAFQDIVEVEVMKYHGSGTDNTAPVAGNTALIAESADTRGTGTTIEGASANIYKTVGTITYGGSRAIVEHGVFSASTSGVLLDRSTFSVINVANNDSIEFTYELTFPAGS